MARPLYIDWKGSSFIIGQNKLDYWYDVVTVRLTGSAETYAYRSYLLRGWSDTDISLTGNISKDNAVDFIPPGTKLEREQFVLVPGNALVLPGQFTVEKVASTVPDRTKPAEVQTFRYTPAASPLTFRNYLTLSTDKDFKTEFVLDSKFWASGVQVMPYRQLTGGQEWLGTGKLSTAMLQAIPYYRPDAFFIHYTPAPEPEGYSVSTAK